MTISGNKAVVLDSWAMMAFLDGEPAARDVRQILRNARKKQVLLFFSIINYGECLYTIEREQGLRQAQRAVGVIDQLPVHIVPVDRPLVFEAAHVKARHSLSYADAFAIALAKRKGARIMTGDPEFRTATPEIAIHWLSDRR